MSKVKLIVNELPQKDSDCPFAIRCSSGYPCICDLKRDKDCDIQFGISFGAFQVNNCKLSIGAPCDMLTDHFEVKHG